MIALWTALGAAAVAALGSYLAASRRLSGKIATSDASSLWQESRSIREDYRERLGVAERRTLLLEERVGKLEGDNNNLMRENGVLLARNTILEATIIELKARLDVLENENVAWRESARVLQITVTELQASLRRERDDV